MLKRIAIVLLLITNVLHAAPVQHLDKIVAIVNEGAITENELNEQVKMLKGQLLAKKTQLPPENILRKQVLQHMIDVDLQLQLAKANDIEVDSVDLNDAIRKIARQNKMSVTQLRKQITNQGMTWAQYRKNLKTEMILVRLQQKALGSTINISPSQVENYVKTMHLGKRAKQQYHIKNIIIPLPDAPSPEEIAAAEQKARKISNKIKTGADFARLAIAESRGEFALEGGDFGYRNLAELPEVFAKQVVKMHVGDVSQPIKTPNGFHIIKLVAIKGSEQKHSVKLTKVRHILIKNDASMTEQQAAKQARNIRNQLTSGKKFAQMAKKYSADVNSAAKGGNLGWVHPGELVPEFEKAMDKLKKHQISKPVKTKYGWHIIQVLNRKNIDDSKSFEKRRVQQYLYQRKFAEAVQNWQQELRGQAFVKIMDKKSA